ncbi:hypothetical protein DFH07DRAFT_935750 [Mycena maculata]|uniref:Uncharacterized protein n=1 Tax=Mycena maculata TaxID=230809 RepID=A0AAD7KB06_9AGAR|nr:hypothetical protein DFH07DRAFT_935750 [Mycena maculata]
MAFRSTQILLTCLQTLKAVLQAIVDRITQDYFDRLVEELRFLDLNDPNGDIASGENPIEDSLFDDIDNQPDAAADAAAAAEETQKSEPPEASVHHSYLQNLRTKTSSEIATHVQDAIVSSDGFKPDSLYHLDVLIWIPHLLAKVILLHVVFADDQQTTFCSQIGICATVDESTTLDVGRPTKALMFISLVNCLGLYSLLFLYTSLLVVPLTSK